MLGVIALFAFISDYLLIQLINYIINQLYNSFYLLRGREKGRGKETEGRARAREREREREPERERERERES